MNKNKFKAWDEDNKIMFFPHVSQNTNGFFVGFNEHGNIECSRYMGKGSWKVFPLVQFVGLHDSTKWDELTEDERSAWTRHSMPSEWKGKEIFEGDILKVPHEVYRLGREVGWEGKEDGFELVYWDDERASFMSKDLSRLKEGWPLEHITGRYLWPLKIAEKSKIIGNKFQNPELLTNEHEEA